MGVFCRFWYFPSNDNIAKTALRDLVLLFGVRKFETLISVTARASTKMWNTFRPRFLTTFSFIKCKLSQSCSCKFSSTCTATAVALLLFTIWTLKGRITRHFQRRMKETASWFGQKLCSGVSNAAEKLGQVNNLHWFQYTTTIVNSLKTRITIALTHFCLLQKLKKVLRIVSLLV